MAPQGSTFPAVEIDLTRTFETGQVYVALSRVRDAAHLRVIGFNAAKIKVDEKALAYYEPKAGP
ncbi:DNA helicase [Tilletia horrida]|nr:DNA helicase [Tilletia horrida]